MGSGGGGDEGESRAVNSLLAPAAGAQGGSVYFLPTRAMILKAMTENVCESCGNDVPLTWERCPHCARPGLFPNVRACQVDAELAALQRRYEKAARDAADRGVEGPAAAFEAAAGRSKAVIARWGREADRLANSDKELYATFYQYLEAGVRLPPEDRWESLRRLADEALFPGYKEKVRFAALSLDGRGLSSYGDCSLVLREDMIAHRASVFEENSALFMEARNYKLPKGHRAAWGERGKLCLAKVAGRLQPETVEEDFPGLLLEQGPTSEEDRFVEVHIWGPMTVRTLERVVVTGKPRRRAFLKELRDRLSQAGVVLEVA